MGYPELEREKLMIAILFPAVVKQKKLFELSPKDASAFCSDFKILGFYLAGIPFQGDSFCNDAFAAFPSAGEWASSGGK